MQKRGGLGINYSLVQKCTSGNTSVSILRVTVPAKAGQVQRPRTDSKISTLSTLRITKLQRRHHQKFGARILQRLHSQLHQCRETSLTPSVDSHRFESLVSARPNRHSSPAAFLPAHPDVPLPQSVQHRLLLFLRTSRRFFFFFFSNRSTSC